MNHQRPLLAFRQTWLLLGLAALAACANPAPPAQAGADSIYFGGSIITVNDAQPTAEAVAVKDGKILAVGARAEIERDYKGQTTTLVDLAGKTLLPAFLDAHSHYYNSLTVANQVNVYAPPAGPGKDPDHIVAELVKFRDARKIPPGEVIQAYGYDENVMPKDNLMNRDVLDKAFPDNPVLVHHVSMHGAVMNSAAMKKWNVSAATKTPAGGVIVRKPGTEEPYGLIMETAFLPIFASLPKPTREQEVEWTRAGQLLYAAAGVTTAHEGATHAGDLEVMKRATDAGANIIDVIAYPFITDLETVLQTNPVGTWGKYDRRLKIGGVKITADGSPQGKTAFFTTPYLTGGPGGEKNWRGEPTFPADTLKQMLKKSLRSGRADELPRQWRCCHRHAAERARVGCRRGPGQGPARHGHPLAVRTEGPARPVCAVQVPSFVLHAPHLLLRRGTHRQPRQGAGDVHQPDARRHRQGPRADQPH